MNSSSPYNTKRSISLTYIFLVLQSFKEENMVLFLAMWYEALESMSKSWEWEEEDTFSA